jgi:hypothetical protein
MITQFPNQLTLSSDTGHHWSGLGSDFGCYQLCLIAYLDILGMKDLLEEAGEDANKVAEVLERRFFASVYTNC